MGETLFPVIKCTHLSSYEEQIGNLRVSYRLHGIGTHKNSRGSRRASLAGNMHGFVLLVEVV